MIRRVWRRAVRFVGSSAFATGVLAFVGLWSLAAVSMPQGGATDPLVVAWASKYPLVEPLAGAVGLHQAFTSPVFAVCVSALTVSTGLCAWQRTKAATHRWRALGKAALADGQSVSESHDLEIACDPTLSGAEVLSIALETLEDRGIRAKRRGDVLSAVSPAWSVLGSPIFHWSLLALIVVIFASSLQRSEGLMGLAVGQTKVDEPKSYGKLSTGPLHDWGAAQRSIRVDAFDLNYTTGGMDRGPTPTVSVLDGAGQVIKTQRVYPNKQLKSGSLAIYPSNYGLAATVSLVNTSGVETGRSVQLLDFSDTADDGTVPSGFITVGDRGGNAELNVSVTVPLQRSGKQFDKSLPEQPTARVVVTSSDGSPQSDSIVGLGEDVTLPTGDRLRVDDVAYYARLQVVDDWSTIPLYAFMFAATLGLTIVVVARQQIVLATVIDGSEGMKLAVRLRLWRNAPCSRDAVESELTRALGGDRGEAPRNG